MIRYSIFLFSVIGMAATAIAHVKPVSQMPSQTQNASTIYMTVAALPAHHIQLEKCAVEDCSDTPQ